MQNRNGSSTAAIAGPLAAHLGEPLTLLDVGSRDGEAAAWTVFEPHVRVIGFEPDAEECARLESAYNGPAERLFVPVAPGEATLHVTRQAQSSSLFEPDTDAIRRHPVLERHELVGRRTIAVSTLDAWLEGSEVERIDFVKLDVQGAELDVLGPMGRRSTPER